ncbi:hypothetical protein QOZ80_9BG0714730 [Eleusine coracana subsp. coracana]|nr:hypothetical protein QOZ80_9BG0714730 [Eleusine coracana subsp. coracana]
MTQVRSVLVFLSAVDDQMPNLERFKFLRVFDLQGCNLSHGYNLDYLGSLFHLRYLSLRGTYIGELSDKVGDLQFLETLDVRDTLLFSLPSTIVQLKRLRRLHVHRWTKISFWIGSLTSLEELSFIHINDDSINTIEALHLLTKLRVLDMCLSMEWNEKMVDCLHKLRKIQSLRIEFVDQRNTVDLDIWVAPPHLRRFQARWCCWFSKLPAWMSSSHLPDLSILTIAVRGLQQKDLEILGRLPSLRRLDLEVDHDDLGIVGRFFIGPGFFPFLVRCGLFGFAIPVVFQHGAMPRLKAFEFEFSVREANEIVCSDSGFYMGLGNLQSLKRVKAAWLLYRDTSEQEVAEAKAAVIHAVEIHPNRPRLRIRR